MWILTLLIFPIMNMSFSIFHWGFIIFFTAIFSFISPRYFIFCSYHKWDCSLGFFSDYSLSAYSNTTDFSMQTLYCEILLNSFIISRSNYRWVGVWELSICNTLSFANSDDYSFSNLMPLISFSCLTALARTSNTKLNESCKS
jgi:hypothetical protein